MKPAPFEYARPDDLGDALKLLSEAGGAAKIMAGAQSLGPMLNLRLAQPSLLVDVRGIGEVHQVTESSESVVYGSCITHAAIEDGRVPDAARGLMREVAGGIAYRAVRNAGTIGGSVCHADPAADWVSVLTLLSAVALIAGRAGRREAPLDQLITGAFTTELADDEIVVGVRVPRLSRGGRWGHYKFCRKPGEFAETVGGIVIDPERGVSRAVIGGTGGAPHVIDNPSFMDGGGFDSAGALAEIDRAGLGVDAYSRQLHHTALRRAAQRMAARH